MKVKYKNIQYKLFILIWLLISFIPAKAQLNIIDIKPQFDNYSFNYNTNPENLVSVATLTGYTFQWQSSSLPLSNFTNITFATSENYSFSAPLTQTMYFRRKATKGGLETISNTIKYELVSLGWENLNYVKEHDILIAGQSDWKVIDQLPIGTKLQAASYFDGLGRQIQSVSKETATPPETAPPNTVWGDNVQFSKYDNFGRQVNMYLPYTSTYASGKFKSNTTTEQPQYYVNTYNETSPFTKIEYDNSPLNRTKKINQPGTSWSASTGNTMAYELNASNENVRVFTIGYTTGAQPVTSTTWAANTLYKSKSVDENGNQVINYVNSLGQSILTKTQIDASPSAAHTGWISVYNVYDDFGLLRFQLQPEAIKWLENNGWSFTGTSGQEVINNLCFRYDYDEKGRVIRKKAPGAEELIMLYDDRDRVVFMQDGNQRLASPAEWTTNIYDDLDRPLLTTLYHTSKTVALLQADIASAALNNNVTLTSHSVTLSTFKNPISSADLNNASINTILNIYFYDNYAFTGVKAFNTSFDNGLAYNTGADPITKTIRTTGMVTGTKIRVLGTSNFLSSSVYYDDKSRVIQSTSDNIKTGTDVITMQYGFDNRLLSTNSKHTATGTAYTNYSVVTKNLFDKLGRINGIEKKYGSNAFKAIGEYKFDDIGRLLKKRLAPGYTGTGKTEIEELAYSYNIHNNITGINKDYALKKTGVYNKWDHFFGLYLGYDNRDAVFTKAELNGQVTGLVWNTQGDDAQRKYDFNYDRAGRLTKATFNEKRKTTDSWSNIKMDFSVSGTTGNITYDLNGNLLNMIQKGVLPGNATPVTVDDLAYTYTARSNKLIKVFDNGNLSTNNGKLGDFTDGDNAAANDYVYDNNGNLVIDLNKKVKNLAGQTGSKGIKYNFLDKPEEIRISGKGVIKIVYDANGNKLQRIFTPEAGGTAKTTTYINEYVYADNELQYINFEEGRIRVVTSKNENNGYDFISLDGNLDLPGSKRGAYDYFIRDYQSNVRMILTEETHTGSNACTMENNRAANEEPIFGKVDANGAPTTDNEVKARFAKANIPNQGSGSGWNLSAIGSYVSRVGNQATSKIGPNTLLKVMAGDKVNASTLYFYQNPVTNTTGNNNLLSSIVTSLFNAIGGTVADPLIKGAAANITTPLLGNIPFSNATNPDAANASGNNPKAYLTVLFFDERFNFIEEGSAAQRVLIAGNSSQPLVLQNIKAPKNGYAYIYVSNEADEPVYFDNLQVSHERGRIIEEDHYYAYGLKIAALSSKKLGDVNEGGLKNNFLFQGDYAEFDDDINWNDFTLRSYDPQLGRFWNVDPYDQFPNPYTGMGNDPINNIDPNGGFSLAGITGTSNLLINTAASTITGALIGGIVGMVTGNDNAWKIGAGIGLVAGLSDGISFKAGEKIIVKIIKKGGVNFANTLARNAENSIEDETKNKINEGRLTEAVKGLMDYYPDELKNKHLKNWGLDEKQAGHITWKTSGGFSVTSFGVNVLSQFGWGYISFGYFTRTIYHEIGGHVMINSEEIKTHFGWNGENEVISYSKQYLNTTLPRMEGLIKIEKNHITTDKQNLIKYYNQMPAEGQSFYKEYFDKTIKIMDDLIKK